MAATIKGSETSEKTNNMAATIEGSETSEKTDIRRFVIGWIILIILVLLFIFYIIIGIYLDKTK